MHMLASVMLADLQYWANIASIVGGFGLVLGVVGLGIAWAQLSRAQKATRGQMLFSIDEALARYDDIRNQARATDWRPPPNRAADPSAKRKRHRIKQYMGVFERIEHLLADGSIDLKTVDSLYGQKAEFLIRNAVVQDYIKSNAEDWETFVNFSNRLRENGRRNLPEL